MPRKDAQPGKRESAADRRVKALDLRKAGASYRAIGLALGVSGKTACKDVQRALATLAKQEQASAAELRALEAARLDDLMIEAYRILKANHPLVSGGKVLSGFTEDGKAIGLTDAGPKIAAIRELRQLSESRRKLFGLDLQPDALPPGDIAIILRWNDGRNIIDVTPPADHGDAAGAPQLTADSSTAPGALPYRVRWETLGQEPIGGDADVENRT